jgi:hypothetical protein
MFDPTTALWVATVVATVILFLLGWLTARLTRSATGGRRLVARTIGFCFAVVVAFLALGYVYFSTGGIILGY